MKGFKYFLNGAMILVAVVILYAFRNFPETLEQIGRENSTAVKCTNDEVTR